MYSGNRSADDFEKALIPQPRIKGQGLCKVGIITISLVSSHRVPTFVGTTDWSPET